MGRPTTTAKLSPSSVNYICANELDVINKITDIWRVTRNKGNWVESWRMGEKGGGVVWEKGRDGVVLVGEIKKG